MKQPRDWSLIIGLSIPVLMVLLVSGSIYLPRLFVDPRTDFLFVIGDEYGAELRYVVEGETLKRIPIEQPKDPSYLRSVASYQMRLFRYDMENDQAREISFEDATALRLDISPTSPDGFEIVPGTRGEGFFLFGWSSPDYNTRYLKGSGGSRKLNIPNYHDGNYYYGSFRFLGWVKE